MGDTYLDPVSPTFPPRHADCPIRLQKTALRREGIIHPFRGINQGGGVLALCDEVPNELRPTTLWACGRPYCSYFKGEGCF
ncbi:hypothetical protein CDAR_254721 [Caerostris darwini]|uniref:Uncharacterized protein n=1 Tax=Caerostris darwini TaxID=1538125 RepID=A0AAV4N374_9ARAC|nr:hypothetical protein CDAR_254721 [Caerostris darwini]